MNSVPIGIIMGSRSDMKIMKKAAEFLEKMNISFELTIVSAHRTPERLVAYATRARRKRLKIIIAGAGGAAHLPGMVASMTSLPVIGVPIRSSNSIEGWDSILSILQMPEGVPVATVALDGAVNAAILAVQILGSSNVAIRKKIENYKKSLRKKVIQSADNLTKQGWKTGDL